MTSRNTANILGWLPSRPKKHPRPAPKVYLRFEGRILTVPEVYFRFQGAGHPPYHEYPQHNANAIPPFLRLVYLGNSPLKRK